MYTDKYNSYISHSLIADQYHVSVEQNSRPRATTTPPDQLTPVRKPNCSTLRFGLFRFRFRFRASAHSPCNHRASDGSNDTYSVYLVMTSVPSRSKPIPIPIPISIPPNDSSPNDEDGTDFIGTPYCFDHYNPYGYPFPPSTSIIPVSTTTSSAHVPFSLYAPQASPPLTPFS